MLHYIIQTVAFQLFFLIIYDVFLKKETFFNWNRVYLLSTALLSIILPFIKIDSFKEAIPQQFIIQLPEVILGSLTQTETNLVLTKGIKQTPEFVFTWQLFFVLGATIALLIFAYKLIKIAALIYKNPKRWQGNLRIVKLIKSNAAFSLFHYIFLGELINAKDKFTILKHETIHVKQNHTADLLLFEMLRILFWFNPLVYMYQNRIRTLHEYIADAKAIKTIDTTQYYENLLSQVFETHNVSFINTFFKQSLIKKRIVMLTKSKSKQILKIKYALLLPMVLCMLLYTSSNAQEKIVDNKEVVSQKLSEFLIVIEKENNKIKLTCKEGCAWKELKFTLFNNESQAIDQFGMTSFSRGDFKKDSKLSNFLFTLNGTENYLKLVGKEGTAWINLSFYCSKDNCQQAIDQFGTTSLDEDFLNAIEIPFTVIDEVPIYPGCENLSTNAERRKCMSERINKLVSENFNSKLGKELGLKGRQRINTIFKIDKNGDIIGIRSRAAHPKLEEEAIRVISLLPKMSPGKQKGEAVIVPYSLPIVFEVAEKQESSKEKIIIENKTTKRKDYLNATEVPFSIVDEVPIYPGCENLSTTGAQKKCIADKINKFVQKNFNTDLAKDLGLNGRQRISVIFKIDKNGNIKGIRSRAPHPKLEAEAARVISLLPKMIPGKHNGSTVIVNYSLPIIFQVEETKKD